MAVARVGSLQAEAQTGGATPGSIYTGDKNPRVYIDLGAAATGDLDRIRSFRVLTPAGADRVIADDDAARGAIAVARVLGTLEQLGAGAKQQEQGGATDNRPDHVRLADAVATAAASLGNTAFHMPPHSGDKIRALLE